MIGSQAEVLVSRLSLQPLGSLSQHLWLILSVLAVTRLSLNFDQLKKKGDTLMKITLNTVRISLTSFAEMVWDIGAKVAAV